MERQSFIGYFPPTEVLSLIKLLNNGKVDQKSQFRPLLTFVVERRESDQQNSTEKDHHLVVDQLQQLAEKTGLSYDESVIMFTGLSKLLSMALRHSFSAEEIHKDFVQAKAPELFSMDFAKAYKKCKSNTKPDTSVGPPTLVSCKWRVNVDISSESLNRSLNPSVLLSLSLSDGSTHTMELSKEKFEQMRFDVASVLSSTITLEQAPILKLNERLKK